MNLCLSVQRGGVRDQRTTWICPGSALALPHKAETYGDRPGTKLGEKHTWNKPPNALLSNRSPVTSSTAFSQSLRRLDLGPTFLSYSACGKFGAGPEQLRHPDPVRLQTRRKLQFSEFSSSSRWALVTCNHSGGVSSQKQSPNS